MHTDAQAQKQTTQAETDRTAMPEVCRGAGCGIVACGCPSFHYDAYCTGAAARAGEPGDLCRTSSASALVGLAILSVGQPDEERWGAVDLMPAGGLSNADRE